jgi:hypothetical protein
LSYGQGVVGTEGKTSVAVITTNTTLINVTASQDVSQAVLGKIISDLRPIN